MATALFRTILVPQEDGLPDRLRDTSIDPGRSKAGALGSTGFRDGVTGRFSAPA